MAALVELSRHALDANRPIEPSVYLKASGEIVFVMVAVSTVITYFAMPSMFSDNPVLNSVGYNNICITWDQPPAKYAAAMLYTVSIYCAWRYSILDSMRASLTPGLSSSRRYFTYVTNTLYMVSAIIILGIFLIAPNADNTWREGENFTMHYLCFAQVVPVRLLVVLANYYEAEVVTRPQWIFLAVFSLASVLLAVLGTYDVIMSQSRGAPQIPPNVMMVIDYTWVLCLPLIGKFWPVQPKLFVAATIMTVVPSSPEFQSPKADSQP